MENNTEIKNIYLFNDTSLVEKNPGCVITVNELKNNLLRNYPDSELICFPLGFAHKYFSGIFNIRNLFFRLIFKLSPVIKEYFLIKKWKKNSRQLEEKEFEKIHKKSLVIINAEGTIHHTSVPALTLLGIAYSLSKKGFDVRVVNGTFTALPTTLLKYALKDVAKVVVREDISYAYLKSLGINRIERGADCVFLADNYENKANLNHKKCLITPGVLYPHPQFNQKIDSEYIQRIIGYLKTKNYHVTFLEVEDKETDLRNEFGCDEIIKVDSYKDYEIFKIISNYNLVISGRYHIILFAGMLGKEIVALPSNTWKIEGGLKWLGINKECILYPHENLELLLSKKQTPNKKIVADAKLMALKNY